MSFAVNFLTAYFIHCEAKLTIHHSVYHHNSLYFIFNFFTYLLKNRLSEFLKAGFDSSSGISMP